MKKIVFIFLTFDFIFFYSACLWKKKALGYFIKLWSVVFSSGFALELRLLLLEECIGTLYDLIFSMQTTLTD